MTVIAALVQDGRVHMAADTAGTFEGRIWHGRGKIVTKTSGDDQVVLGFAGDSVVAALVARHLELDPLPVSREYADERAWAIGVAEAVCRIALAADPAPLDDGGEGSSKRIDGHALMGFRGGLWLVTQQDADKVTAPFAAIGSGGDIATGALAVLPGDLMPARDQLEAAIEAACAHAAGCGVDVHGMVYVVA